jgi:mRNA-degrading endonuclease toxin of MazEF toxin-antitoxin module
LSKPRPALVLFDLQRDVLICRITSAQYSGPLDIAISDWAAAGLAKPSIARLNRLVTAEKTLLGRHLGRLTAGDAANIRTAWNQYMRL